MSELKWSHFALEDIQAVSCVSCACWQSSGFQAGPNLGHFVLQSFTGIGGGSKVGLQLRSKPCLVSHLTLCSPQSSEKAAPVDHLKIIFSGSALRKPNTWQLCEINTVHFLVHEVYLNKAIYIKGNTGLECSLVVEHLASSWAHVAQNYNTHVCVWAA